MKETHSLAPVLTDLYWHSIQALDLSVLVTPVQSLSLTLPFMGSILPLFLPA